MTNKEIIKIFRINEERILGVLKARGWRHFNDYFFIQDKYLNKKLDEDFRRVFCRFYVLNGARGLTRQQKNLFFKLFSQREIGLEEILEEMYKISGYKGSRRLFLSFGTKLLHTKDTDLPIYDKNVASFLQLKSPTNHKCLRERILDRTRLYNELKFEFSRMMADTTIRKHLIEVRTALKKAAKVDDFNWRDDLISNIKILDSIIWAVFYVLKNRD